MNKHEHTKEANGMILLGQEITRITIQAAQAAGVTPTGAASVLLYSAASILLEGAGMGKKEATDVLIELCKDMQEFVMSRSDDVAPWNINEPKP